LELKKLVIFKFIINIPHRFIIREKWIISLILLKLFNGNNKYNRINNNFIFQFNLIGYSYYYKTKQTKFFYMMEVKNGNGKMGNIYINVNIF